MVFHRLYPKVGSHLRYLFFEKPWKKKKLLAQKGLRRPHFKANFQHFPIFCPFFFLANIVKNSILFFLFRIKPLAAFKVCVGN